MITKAYKNLLLSLLLVFNLSCSIPSTYSRQEIDEVIKKICKEEFNIEVNAWFVGDTVWVYAPLKLYDESGKLKVNAEGEAEEDLSDTMRKISLSISRALLNVDKPPKFYCFIKSDIKRFQEIDLLRMDYYELVFIPDLIKLEMASRGLGIPISGKDVQERVVSIQIPSIDSRILRDKQGTHIHKYDISIVEFISLLIQQKILRTFLSEKLKDNFQINDLSVDYTPEKISIRFNIMIRQYKQGLPIPLEEIEKITKRILTTYSSTITIPEVLIIDDFNEKSKTFSFASRKRKASKLHPYSYDLGTTRTLLKLSNVNSYLALAYNISQQQGDALTKAITFYKKALQIIPNYLYISIVLGETYNQLGQTQKALKVFQEALKKDPYNPTIHNSLGESYLNLGKYLEALRHFEQTFLLYPNYPGILQNLSQVHIKLGDSKKALYYLKKAVEKINGQSSNDAEAYRQIGNTYLNLGQYQKALIYLQKAKELNRQYPLVYISLGDFYLLSGNSNKAIINFEKALSLDPNSISAQLGLGHTYLALGQYQKAIDQYKKILEVVPDSPETYLGLAQAYNKLGMVKNDSSQQYQAITYLKKTLKLQPDNPRVYYLLGQTYVDLGQFSTAINYFQKALNINPESAQVYFGLANAYYYLQNNQKAKENFQKARDLFLKQGDQENARKAEENIRNIP